MITGARRTAIAFLLVTLAVGLPSLAWYVAGSREHRRETERLTANAECTASDTSRRLAASLAARLEALRETESKRPFYHYQNLYHDPEGAHDGPSVVPSPLASGPQDPLIRAHFQVDPQGRVGIPTLNPDVPERNSGVESAVEHEVLAAIAACGTECRVSVADRTATAPRDDPGGIAPATFGPGDAGGPRRGWTRSVMDETAWLQIVNASHLYVDLMGWDGSTDCVLRERTLSTAPGSSKVVVEAGPFHWRTATFAGEPTLIALREVRTPVGSFSQGFVIDHDRAAGWIDRTGSDAAFVPAGSSDRLEAVLPIHGTEWAVALDDARIVEDALGVAAAGVTEFRTRFGLAVAAAWLVGLSVVGLVWQAERIAQQRSRFAASAAHELRTPLAGLRMYGEMLAEGLGDPARRGDYARRIASESERLGRVVSNVLGFARLERGLLNVTCRRGDLSAAILECTRGQRPTLEAAGVTLRMDLPADYPEAWFDRDALCEVLQNLLDNAEKYTRGCADRTVTVALERGGRRARIVISDHGPGVPPDRVRRLFRPFERGTDKDAPAGLGLGLVLSRALARAMDGDLDYEPAPAGGSRFVVRLRI